MNAILLAAPCEHDPVHPMLCDLRLLMPLMMACALSLHCTGTAAAETTAPLNFNGEKALELLATQVDYGPRLPGAEGHKKTRELILNTLAENGFTTGVQSFAVTSPLLNKPVTGFNLYGIFPPGKKVKYLLSAHYDTRPYADQDLNPARQKDPVPGANDGASGVAVLLELARVIPSLNLPHGVGLAFFDLEDHGVPTEPSTFCLGSNYMAQNLPPALDFELGINLDMVGDYDLKLPMEGYSLMRVGPEVTKLWQLGNQLYPQVFLLKKGPSVFDDHMPFLMRGRKYIDVIDFEYPAWHTTDDTTDKVSPESLEAVGLTMQRFIQN